MINAILNLILKLILWVAGLIYSVITVPILALVNTIFPDFSVFLSDFQLYVTDYLFKGLAFAREVFLSITGFPRPLLTLLVTIFLGKFAFHFAVLPIKFIINIYRSIRGSGGEMVE